MQINLRSILLETAYKVSPYVKHFVFKTEDGLPFSYIPGQFITIHFTHAEKTLKRSYSIANHSSSPHSIEFAAGYVENGPGTQLLFNLNVGDKINITGPFGRLTLKEQNPKRYIFIGTSTGITPYRAMLNELKKCLDSNPDLNIVFLEGVQKHEDILYADDFINFSNQHSQAQFYAYLSRGNKESLNAFERVGYVQHGLPELSLNPLNDMVYLCGNPGMIDETFNYLKQQGFDSHQIIREKYISAPTK